LTGLVKENRVCRKKNLLEEKGVIIMYRVEIKSQNSVFEVVSQGNKIEVDTAGDSGFSPLNLFLAGLGSCVCVYVEKYLKGRGIKNPGFKLTAESEFCRQLPFRFEKIRLNLNLKGTALEERDRKRLTEFVKNCPVHQTVVNNPQIQLYIS
jgi:uncharacterized OsmC-like protein